MSYDTLVLDSPVDINWKPMPIVPREPTGDYLPARDFAVKRSIFTEQGAGNWRYIGQKIPLQARRRKVSL